MQKETIIVIILVILIIIGNIITQKYTKKSVTELNEQLEELRTEINRVGKEDMDKESIKELMKKIKDDWEEHYSRLAYYLEHNELEKVKTGIIILSSNIETNDYEEAISKIAETKFILEHIQDKYAFSVENIF